MSDKDKPGEEPQPDPVEQMLNDLPLKDEQKAVLAKVISGVATNLNQINTRLADLEKQPANENPDIYTGLSADQKYQVLMARASAPAAEAQQTMVQALLARAGGGGGGDLAGLLKSANTLQALRTLLNPEPSTLQQAMEKAQVLQIFAQTRLMNKVAGKSTSDFLDKIEKDLEAAAPPGAGESEET